MKYPTSAAVINRFRIPIKSADFNFSLSAFESFASPQRMNEPSESFPAPILFRQAKIPARAASSRTSDCTPDSDDTGRVGSTGSKLGIPASSRIAAGGMPQRAAHSAIEITRLYLGCYTVPGAYAAGKDQFFVCYRKPIRAISSTSFGQGPNVRRRRPRHGTPLHRRRQ